VGRRRRCNDRSDHKRSLILCRAQTFPNPNACWKKLKR
jgi:hypothetical protein